MNHPDTLNMKTIIISLIGLIWILTTAPGFSQSKDIVSTLEKALQAGQASEVSRYFEANVNLAIPGTDGVFTKEQAAVILKDFFQHNKPTSFKVTHKGKSGEGAAYFVGTLTCVKKKFSIYILMRDSGKSSTIRQFQAEAD